MALPCATTAALATLPGVVPLPVAAGVPLPMLLVIAAQLIGLLLAREVEQATWRRFWLMVIVITALLFPALALSTAASRVPFVSLSLGSAGTLLWTTALTAVLILGVAALAAVQAVDEPQHASLFFAPAAVLIPAVVGAPGNLGERATLPALAEAMALAAVVVAVAWLAPPGARLLASPVALAGQFAALWFLDYRPMFGEGRGAVAIAAVGFILVLGIVTAVLVPIAALNLRRFMRVAATLRPVVPDPEGGGPNTVGRRGEALGDHARDGRRS